MRAALLTLSAGHEHLVRRQLQLRREISTQRGAISRARSHGETRGTIARLDDALRRLELEMEDVTRLLAQQRREVA